MRCTRLIIGLWVAVGLAIAPAALAAEAGGQIFGQVVLPDRAGLPGVTVTVEELAVSRTTGADGTFRFDGVAPGRYTLVLTLGDRSLRVENVEVSERGTAVVQQEVDWAAAAGIGRVVYAAGRQTQRLVDAPAAASTVAPESFLGEGVPWDVGKLVEFLPGADLSWSSLGDLNLNTRGFSSSLNRRVLVLFDGRDLSNALMSAQEWHAIPFVMSDLRTVELIRGPGSALYGANAYNGVLNIVAKEPRYSLGGDVVLAGGELGSGVGQARFATSLGNEWYLKVWGGYETRDQTSVSRMTSSEYPGVPREPVGVEAGDISRTALGVRLDKYFARGRLLTLEGGNARLEGPVFQTGIGRVHVLESLRPYLRFNFNTAHFNLLAYWDRRNAKQRSLTAGGLLYEDSSKWEVELQGNTRFAQELGRLVGGASYRSIEADSASPQGVQTIIAGAQKDHSWAAFGQLDYDLSAFLHGLLAVRVDDGSLIDRQVSPKATLLYSLTRDQSLRLKYDQAFQTPNYLERFLSIPAGRPADLSALETALQPLLGGVSLGFSAIPRWALGNERLDVEKITSYELGYTAVLGSRALLSANYYYSKLRDFVSELLPGVNPAWGPYRPPSALPAAVQQAIIALLQQNLPPEAFRAMTNGPNGAPMFVVSYTNFGKVTTQGVELEMTAYPRRDVEVGFAYSYLDYTVKQGAPGASLLPNSPKHRATASLAYHGSALDAGVKLRWVDSFLWSAGVFEGMVASYLVADLAMSYRFASGLRIGAHVLNALDDDHIEVFGGDVGRRRALAYLGLAW